MQKYKQTYIPSVKTGVISNNRKSVAEYYQTHIAGKSVTNKHLNIVIKFNKEGKKELSYGRAIHSKKVALLQCLPKLLEVATYNNFGIRKETDPQSWLGYMNFKAFVLINGKKECVRLTCILRKDGSLYYNHEVNIIKRGNRTRP